VNWGGASNSPTGSQITLEAPTIAANSPIFQFIARNPTMVGAAGSLTLVENQETSGSSLTNALAFVPTGTTGIDAAQSDIFQQFRDQNTSNVSSYTGTFQDQTVSTYVKASQGLGLLSDNDILINSIGTTRLYTGGDTNVSATNVSITSSGATGLNFTTSSPAANIRFSVANGFGGLIISNSMNGGWGTLTVDSGNNLWWNGTRLN
jgi:hypothetical protein